MTPANRSHEYQAAAFSLVELLAVMAIMATMIMVVATNAPSLLRGSQLAQASQLVHDQFTLARQTALSSNLPVEVRLYRFADPEAPDESGGSSTGKFRALQLFLIQPSGDKAIGKFQRLPKPIIIDSGLTLSPLIALAQDDTSTPALDTGEKLSTSIPVQGTNYEAAIFRFQPDGSTNLPPSREWFLTLHELKEGDKREDPPRNFSTLQIDVTNGRSRVFRP